MGRLQPEFLERVERFGDRILDVADTLDGIHKLRRVVDQMHGCGTSIGANAYEADEAMSRKDFCRCLGVSLKELNESRYWLRTCVRRGWVPQPRLTDLLGECDELKRIVGAIIVNTRRAENSLD